jgi:hypothetical protein
MRRVAAEVLLALAVPLPALAQQSPSTNERMAMSAEKADRTARRDLLSILEPTGKYKRGMFTVVRGAYFSTRPYVTIYPGLCEVDNIRLRYAVAGQAEGAASRNLPLMPYGVEAYPTFHITRDKLVRPSGESASYDPFDAECTGLMGQKNRNWFSAPNIVVVLEGYAALMAAGQRLRDASFTAVRCENHGRDPAKCRAGMIEAANRDRILSIGTCEAPKGQLCFEVGSDPFTLTLRLNDGALTPASVQSVEADIPIIVT